MKALKFKSKFMEFFPFELTKGQKNTVNTYFKFLFSEEKRKCFIINGYAGTGKTSMLKAFVHVLPSFNYNFMLLAPTGRAAKVMSSSTSKKAYTIHRVIYRKKEKADGLVSFGLGTNMLKNTIFFIDEVSMIGSSNSERSLLEDLHDYVHQGENCHLVLIGDEAQLPPIGEILSKALMFNEVESLSYNLQVFYERMTDVVRQKLSSGILKNATLLRDCLDDEEMIKLSLYPDFQEVSSNDFIHTYEDLYDSNSPNENIIITRSNKTALLINKQIRNRVFWCENELEGSERLMVVRNNYYWTKDSKNIPFLANGDFIRLKKIFFEEERYGCRFAKVLFETIDYTINEEFETFVLLDALHVEGAQVSNDYTKNLYHAMRQDFIHLRYKTKIKEAIYGSPYYNALHLKYGYAITCHKSQGGQWDNVFVLPELYKSEQINLSLKRWFYSAITRAKNNVYLISPPEFIIEN
jgi:exodeoxyribonuclease V